jgi:hypothetical protein
LALAASLGSELRPVVIHFFLRVATHDKRDRFSEVELWAAIECGELLAVELEFDGEDAAFRAGTCFGCTYPVEATGVLEDGEVERDGFFRIGVEPEKRCYAREALKGVH